MNEHTEKTMKKHLLGELRKHTNILARTGMSVYRVMSWEVQYAIFILIYLFAEQGCIS